LLLIQPFPFFDLQKEFYNPLFQQAVDQLKPNDGDNSVVIYPIWTSAAYHEPGFYTYFRGDCDESCITDVSFENAIFEYTSSGLTTQILYHAGYDFLTEIDVDKKANKKTFKAPIIDESEEYFVAYKITNHDTPKTKANLNDKAKIIPK